MPKLLLYHTLCSQQSNLVGLEAECFFLGGSVIECLTLDQVAVG